MKYFKDVNTLETLRKEYKELLKKYHPDNANGSTEATQEINAEYDKLFKTLKDRHSTATADSTDNSNASNINNMKYDFTEDAKLREILQKIVGVNGIDIEIIGSWIWVSGNTYLFKNELKANGFKWASNKRMWYWHSDNYQKKSRKSLSMEDIRDYYGSMKVQTNAKVLLEA